MKKQKSTVAKRESRVGIGPDSLEIYGLWISANDPKIIIQQRVERGVAACLEAPHDEG